MTILHYFKCETCDKTHQYSISVNVPEGWLSLYTSNTLEGLHFCSEKCLAQWMYGNATQEESDKPPCKARRFILVEGETAKSYTGVKFDSDHVAVDFETGDFSVTYPSWDIFIRTLQDDDRIQWIDQEDKA